MTIHNNISVRVYLSGYSGAWGGWASWGGPDEYFGGYGCGFEAYGWSDGSGSSRELTQVNRDYEPMVSAVLVEQFYAL